MRAWLKNFVQYLCGRFSPRMKVIVVVGDTLPAALPPGGVILLRDAGSDWSVGFHCPCGCGDVIELLLLPDVRPRWEIAIDRRGCPTLHPSIWRQTGCRSHFWLREGRVRWVE